MVLRGNTIIAWLWWRDYGQGGASGPTLLLRAADGVSNRPFGQIVAGSQDPAFKRATARFLLWPCQRLGWGWERAAITGYGAVFLASIVPCDKNDHFHMKQYDKDV